MHACMSGKLNHVPRTKQIFEPLAFSMEGDGTKGSLHACVIKESVYVLS